MIKELKQFFKDIRAILKDLIPAFARFLNQLSSAVRAERRSEIAIRELRKISNGPSLNRAAKAYEEQVKAYLDAIIWGTKTPGGRK